MAKRGRKPAPNTLKIAAGVHPCRLNPNEIVPPAGVPECPDFLDPVARAEWDRLAPILTEMGVLTIKDGTALAIYCDAYSTWVHARWRLKVEGRICESVRGTQWVNPYDRIVRDSYKTMLKVLAEFGCTPSSQTGVRSTKPPAKNELDLFLESS